MFQVVGKSFPKKPWNTCCQQGQASLTTWRNKLHVLGLDFSYSLKSGKLFGTKLAQWDWAMDSPELWWLPDRFNLAATENGVKAKKSKLAPTLKNSVRFFFPFNWANCGQLTQWLVCHLLTFSEDFVSENFRFFRWRAGLGSSTNIALLSLRVCVGSALDRNNGPVGPKQWTTKLSGAISYDNSSPESFFPPFRSGEGCWIMSAGPSPPSPPSPPPSRRTSTASSRSQCSPPDPHSNRDPSQTSIASSRL